MDIIRQALDKYEQMVETGKLRGYSLYEVNCIYFILRDLAKGDTSETITKKIADWFAKRGFSVAKSGVGWTIDI